MCNKTRVQRSQQLKFGGGAEADGECGALAYNGVWGHSPQRGPGAEPWSEDQGEKRSLKLKTF